MKRISTTLITLLFAAILFAQNENPYSQFGYEAPVMQANQDSLIGLLIVSADTTSQIGFVIVDVNSRQVFYYSHTGIQYLQDTLPLTVVTRWLTTDPAKQHHSPYLSMGNRPTSRIDPDGNTDFEGADGMCNATIDDGSNAVFRITGSNQDQYYEFNRWEDIGGENFINVTNLIAEQQNFNMINPALVKGWDGTANTWCNRATMNVVNAVQSGFNAMGFNGEYDYRLPMANANTIGDYLATNPDLFTELTAANAFLKADAGNLVITSWIHSDCNRSGHLTTLSAGANIKKGRYAHVGTTNGFRTVTGSHLRSQVPDIQYYMLNIHR